MDATYRRRLRRLAPDRIGWWPGDDESEMVAFQYLESNGGGGWYEAARQLLQDRVHGDLWAQVGKPPGTILRLATRNLRTLGGCAVSTHSPDENVIHAIWVHDRYLLTTPCLYDLITLATLEVPEAPTRIVVPEDDVATQKLLRLHTGWSSRSDGDSIQFERPPIVAVGPEGRFQEVPA